MTRGPGCLGERPEDRRPRAGLHRELAEGQCHGPRSGRAIVPRDQLHEKVAVTCLAGGEQGSRIDGHAAACVLHGKPVACQQFSQRVGCGPRFRLDVQAVAHAVRRTGRRATPRLDEPDGVRQGRAQALRHGLGGEVLVKRHGGPLTLGRDTQWQRVGEGHPESRVESLCGPDRQTAPAQRPLEQAAPVQMAEEPRVSVLGEAQGHLV